MEWTVVLAGPARKSLKRIPAGDRTRILAALAEMQENPVSRRHPQAAGPPWLSPPDWELADTLRARTREQTCGGGRS
jgi:hypothetical protein